MTEPQVLPDRKARQVQTVHKARRESQGQQVHKGCKVSKVQQALKDRQARKA